MVRSSGVTLNLLDESWGKLSLAYRAKSLLNFFTGFCYLLNRRKAWSLREKRMHFEKEWRTDMKNQRELRIVLERTDVWDYWRLRKVTQRMGWECTNVWKTFIAGNLQRQIKSTGMKTANNSSMIVKLFYNNHDTTPKYSMKRTVKWQQLQCKTDLFIYVYICTLYCTRWYGVALNFLKNYWRFIGDLGI